MKDREFLELLNLYLDHEIDAAGAAQLEAEVQANPERRQTYLEYCRMQKACSQLSDRFADEVSPPERLRPQQKERSPLAGIWVAGGFAAAACLALVLVVRSRQTPSVPAVAIAVAPAVKAHDELRTAEKPGAFTTVPFSLHSSQALASSEPSQLEWMNQVKFSPIRGDSTQGLRFDTKPILAPKDQALRVPEISQAPLQITAFQIQR